MTFGGFFPFSKLFKEETEIPNEPEVQLKNSSGKYLSNNKNNKNEYTYINILSNFS